MHNVNFLENTVCSLMGIRSIYNNATHAFMFVISFVFLIVPSVSPSSTGTPGNGADVFGKDIYMYMHNVNFLENKKVQFVH